MKAHLLQLDIVWEDKDANHDRVRGLLASSPPSHGDLIVLPELFDVGFTLNTDIAIDRDGSTLAWLQGLADETGCLVHGARAIAAPVEGKAYNCAAVVAPGQTAPICEYAKIHPFSYGREAQSYEGGNEMPQYQWGQLPIAPAVCYDLRFPELFRHAIKAGAQAFVLGANWPSPRTAHWRTLCIARAIENQAFVIAVNRCGSDPHLTYEGCSIVVDPQGQILGELDDQEGMLSVEIDPALVSDWRQAFPALADIRLI